MQPIIKLRRCVDISQTSEQLFNYLRDILYDPDNATLDIAVLDEEYQPLGKGLQFLSRCLDEQRLLATNLSKGNLTIKLPPPDNVITGPLKALHAALLHLTWQSRQVAKGDYQQRIDFMGEFADSFNIMTEQLDQRQKALTQEIEQGRKKTMALEQSNSLLETITDEIEQWIIVVDKNSWEVLFRNKSAADVLDMHPAIEDELQVLLADPCSDVQEHNKSRDIELAMLPGGPMHYFSVLSWPIHWRSRNAVAHVLRDVSDEKKHVQKLENYAYQDNLTQVHNRFFGMQILRDWLSENRTFCICFVDLDNLKLVNDSFGHSEGDRYIIRVSNKLKEMCPNAETCRLGGDEFMVLGPDMTGEECEARMWELRQEVIDDGKSENIPYYSSLSYGIVEVKPDNVLTSSELLGLADERMYRFKRARKTDLMGLPALQSANRPEPTTGC